MPETPPGWYADPHQPAQQRWWDGAQWTPRTAPIGQAPAAVAAAEPATKNASSRNVLLIVGGVVLLITLLTRSLGVILMLAGVVLFVVAIVAIVRGSARLFRVHSRGAAWAALAIAFALMFVGSAANAALGGPTSTSDSATTGTEPKPLAAVATETPTPTPKPTTFEDVEESVAIPFERTTIDDPNIDVGQVVVTTAGVDGTKVTTYRVRYVDGVERSREVVSEVVTVAPVSEVTSNGTRQPAPPPPPAPVPFAQAGGNCDPNYSGACVPIASDVDCEGGSGDGPAYVRGPVTVIGSDIYKLDRDGDGIGCD